MFRKCLFGLTAAVALAATSLLLLPETSYAQRRGGVGVYRGGGIGGYRGGYYGGYGGYRGGYYGGSGLYLGIGPRYYGSPYGYSNYGYSYPYGYTRYYSPSYGSYYNPGYSYYTPSYDYSYTPGYTYSYTPEYTYSATPAGYSSNGSTQAYQPSNPPANSTDNTVHFQVNVPSPDAEIWVEGSPTQQRGMSREFQSPPLTPGRDYTYHIRARWMENGQMRDQTRVLKVHAGEWETVNFTADDTSGTISAPERTTQARPAANIDGEIGPTGRVSPTPPAPK